jgi:hypothetical protein
MALRLIGEIQLPNIVGRLDHFAIDESRKLLFIACLGAGESSEMAQLLLNCFLSSHHSAALAPTSPQTVCWSSTCIRRRLYKR